MEQVWIAIAAVVAGGFIGFLLGRNGNDSAKEQQLTDQLNEAQRELAEYKDKVSNHFEETAKLVNNLTDSYKAVHKQLAEGSQSLCNDIAISQALEAVAQPTLTQSDEASEAPASAETEAETAAKAEAATEAVQAPLDYAPKQPDQEGTLSETFGVESQKEEATPQDPAELAEMQRKQEKAEA